MGRVTDHRRSWSNPSSRHLQGRLPRQKHPFAVVRQAWDTGTLRTLTRNNPLTATDAHISIIGHITAEELRRHLTSTEAANGFANRFLWLPVRRSKQLPDGGNLDPRNAHAPRPPDPRRPRVRRRRAGRVDATLPPANSGTTSTATSPKANPGSSARSSPEPKPK